MPKRTKYPGLRRHSWTTKSGERKTAYYFDRRAQGLPDEALGTDHAQALIRWHELTFNAPRDAGTLKEAIDRWELEALPSKTPATRRDYALALTQLRPYFEPARWADVTMPALVQYLEARTAKRRANLELSVLSVIWNWSRQKGLTTLQWPAAGMERSKWKNVEHAAEVEWSEQMFAAMYVHAEPFLRDAMDLTSATGWRVRDAIKCRLTDVRGGVLVFTASKTGKRGSFDLAESPVLSGLIERRRASKAPHIFLLTRGNMEVTERMLTDAWARARAKAVKDCPEVKGLMLRYVRKYAGQLCGSLADAQALLQHGSPATTQRHYRAGEKLRPVR